jgi:hypothetical protein
MYFVAGKRCAVLTNRICGFCSKADLESVTRRVIFRLRRFAVPGGMTSLMRLEFRVEGFER